MIIHSKFKDYYDYIGHRFGQDKEAVYNRGHIPNAEGYKFDCPKEKPRYNASPSCWSTINGLLKISRRKGKDWSEVLSFQMIAAGKLLIPILEIEHIEDRWFNGEKYSVTEVTRRVMTKEDWEENFNSKNAWDKTSWESIQLILQRLEPKFQVAQRDLGSPVFLMYPEEYHPVTVNSWVPVLAEYGVPAVIPAEQMWQNIYTCLTSVLRKDPDKEPPVEISNQDKIVKAGFDLKTSFRNPINPKPKKKR